MNYRKIYDQIINRAKSRPKPECYCEKHHIIPRSLGGSDEPSNIAVLTAREHFLAHWLLKKINPCPKMIYAFFAMTKPVGNGRTRYTSRSFEYARKAMSKLMTERLSGKNNHWYGVKGEDNIHTGMKRSDKTKKLLSKMAKERYKKSEHQNSKKIVCVETGEVFESIAKAKKKHTVGNINYALKTGGKAGGLRFVYFGQTKHKKLNGYASGSKHPMSYSVKRSDGKIYDSVASAARSLSVTGSAISYSIKNNSKCKGFYFERN